MGCFGRVRGVVHTSTNSNVRSNTLHVVRPLPWERVHHFDSRTGDRVVSTGALFEVRRAGVVARFQIPTPGWLRVLAKGRLARRLLRLDRYTAAWDPAGEGVVVVTRAEIYRYDWATRRLVCVQTGAHAHALLHGSIAVGETRMVFGAYGPNTARGEVPVWSSVDGGWTWKEVHVFRAGEVRHVHNVSWDPLGDAFWVATGDEDGECYLYRFDRDMQNPHRFGDGGQSWRAVGLLFDASSVTWGMDAPGETCRLMTLDRTTGRLSAGAPLGGPVWYVKRLADGVSLLQTTVEPGVRATEDMCTIWARPDGEEPYIVHRYAKDGLPAGWGRYGQVLFATGHQTTDNFVCSGMGLRGLEGGSVCMRLER